MAGMTSDGAPGASLRRLGEMKGPLVVWLFVLAWLTTAIGLQGSSKDISSQPLTPALVLTLVAAALVGYGPILLLLVVFVRWKERKRSFREVLSGLGFKKEGIRRSLFWCVALLPAFAAVSVVSSVAISLVSHAAGPQVLPSNGGSFPGWYLLYLILYAFFPVAITEEALGRGYLLDRLMPQHPSNIARAMPAVLLSSLMFTAYHLPGYFLLYPFSRPQAVVLLATNVFPFSVLLSIAYVRARARNVAGPVFLHFIFDAAPYVLLAVLG